MKRALVATVSLCVVSCNDPDDSDGTQAAGSGGSLSTAGMTNRGWGGSATGGIRSSVSTGATGQGGARSTAGSTAIAAQGGAADNGTGGTAGAGNTAGTVRTGGTAGAGNAAGAGDDGMFNACANALKAKCPYDEPESACSSIMTPEIPLSDGTTWGNIELMQGPYGSYVEWNEGAAFANPKNLMESTCAVLAGTFGEPQSVTENILDLRGQDLTLYTVFRPACMRNAETYPVITWGNGTCGQSGGYAALLATVASYGFVIIAPNSRWTNQGNDEMLKALDFAAAANADSSSILYQKLDLSRVGAMGHSQGGAATAQAASDSRVKAVILWNGGTSASKPFLTISGDRDIGGQTSADMASAINGAAQPGAWLYYHKVLETGGGMTGHLTLMEQPERVTDPTIAWWKYILNGDAEAKKKFVGTDCGLCNKKDDYEFGQKKLP